MMDQNKSPNAAFSVIGATLDSGDKAARLAAVNQIAELITTAQPFFFFPDAAQLHPIIASLSSILCDSHSDVPTNRAVRRTLMAIRSRVAGGRTAMDAFACRAALHAIHCCWEDEALGYILRDAADLRLLSTAAQRGAVTVMRACLPRRSRARAAPAAGDVRCVVVAFTSLLSSPHAGVVSGCADALVALSADVPGLACAVAKAYCDLLARTSSSLQISGVLMVLDRMQNNLSSVIMESSGEDDMAMLVVRALAFRDLRVQQKVLNLALSLITPWNVDSMVVFLRNEMNVAAVSNQLEYRGILEKAIYACHGKYLKA